jgi:hypothetical protein
VLTSRLDITSHQYPTLRRPIVRSPARPTLQMITNTRTDFVAKGTLARFQYTTTIRRVTAR